MKTRNFLLTQIILFVTFMSIQSVTAIPADNPDKPKRGPRFLGPSVTGAVSLASRREFGGEVNLGLAYGHGMSFTHYGLTAGAFSKGDRLAIGATAAVIGLVSARISMAYSKNRFSEFTDIKLGVGALLGIGYFRLQRDNHTGNYEGEIGIEMNFPIVGAF